MVVKNTGSSPAAKTTIPASPPKEDTPFISFLKKNTGADATKFIADAPCDLSARGIDSCALYRRGKQKEAEVKKLFRSLTGLDENADVRTGRMTKGAIAKGLWKMVREIRGLPANDTTEVDLNETISRSELQTISKKHSRGFGGDYKYCSIDSFDRMCSDAGFWVKFPGHADLLVSDDKIDATPATYAASLNKVLLNPDGTDGNWESFLDYIAQFDDTIKSAS